LRRSKKQPDYDPNELADLIETPAVGTGVGSHLLIPNELNEVTTVVETDSTSVVTPTDTGPSDIVPGRKLALVTSEESSVVISESTIVVTELPTSVATCLQDTSELTPIVTSPAEVSSRLWISDSGEIVPGSRVRRLAEATEALSSGELTLYQLLWNSQPLGATPEARSIQAGYEMLTRQTGFSRKTIQRTIDRLTFKQFIEIETPADIYSRTPTVYRVFESSAVLRRLIADERSHIAKIGPGVAFVTPLRSLDQQTTAVSSNVSTVDS
jgi:hypothetical protein